MKLSKRQKTIRRGLRRAVSRLMAAERELGRAKLAYSNAYRVVLTSWPR